MAEQEIGAVTHYFRNIEVAALELTGKLEAGQTIHIRGHTSDFTQVVESMQIENERVESAKPGDKVGIKVLGHAREHDKVYLVTPD
jgi:putative protease